MIFTLTNIDPFLCRTGERVGGASAGGAGPQGAGARGLPVPAAGGGGGAAGPTRAVGPARGASPRPARVVGAGSPRC